MEANLAVLIDFENIAAGTEKEGLGRFDVDALMKRLKDKGRILVARSYADWGRFARFKQTLLSCNVTMMELTSHGMQDKNRADIAMVVDCLELAFTKSYVDTFVVVSGDSDFTPLVLKMRELNKRVIGIGTRSSTSRLLVQACDEFLFYDTIVKESRASRLPPVEPRPGISHAHHNNNAAHDDEAIFELLVDALEGIQRENPEPCLASIVKTGVLRKSPDFNEVDLGFGSFAKFLELAQAAGYVRLSRDQKSGGYRVDSVDSRTGAAPARHEREDHDDEEDDDRDSRGIPDPWLDPYCPEGAAPYVHTLTTLGMNPLAYPTRMSILQLAETEVADRKKRRRRITLPFVQEDVRKRLKKVAATVPGRAVRGVFTAMLKGGLLLHKDGRAIRSGSAPFIFGKDAEGLNKALVTVYLDALGIEGADLSKSEILAGLLLGDAGRRREIEEAVAWLRSPPSERREAASAESDLDDLDFDALLLADEPEPAPVVISAPVVIEYPSPVADDLDAMLSESAPEAEADAEKPKPRRRRTKAPAKKKDDATDDLDGLLAVDED